MPDGIGAQLQRKVIVKAYANLMGYNYYNEPITDFLIHESDHVNNQQEKNTLMFQFNNLIKHSNEGIDLDAVEEISTNELDVSQIKNYDFLNIATSRENRIVIHIRRGNVIPGNPRWIDESEYVSVINNIDSIADQFNLNSPKVVILTDSPNKAKTFKPTEDQQNYWYQDFLVPDSLGEYPLTAIDPNNFKDIEIVNNLGTYESFLYMLDSALIIPSCSAFSRCAARLTRNSYLDLFNVMGSA
jgi:hypothetical protein